MITVAGLWGEPSSSIGIEKRFNPALDMDKAAFVREVSPHIPPRPTAMDRIVAANIAA